jgi:hypothetical protein
LLTRFENFQSVALEGSYIITVGTLGLLGTVRPRPETGYEQYRAWSSIREVTMLLPNYHYLLEEPEPHQEEADLDDAEREGGTKRSFSEYGWTRHREKSFVSGPYTQVRYERDEDSTASSGK